MGDRRGDLRAVGTRFAHILTDCGARAMFLSPAHGLHGHTGVISPDDLLVAMSRGGESDEVIQMVSIANQRQAITMAFVHNIHSRLAQVAQHVLPIRSKAEYELMDYVATTSTLAFSAMCDALCAVVQQAKGYTVQQLSQTHPGGAVGQNLEALRPADSASKGGVGTEGNASCPMRL